MKILSMCISSRLEILKDKCLGPFGYEGAKRMCFVLIVLLLMNTIDIFCTFNILYKLE